MKDPWNPTQEEIKDWAYSDDMMPEEDWELALADFNNLDLIFSFIKDSSCLKREFFLGCLYVYVGDLVTGKQSKELEKLRPILGGLKDEENDELKNWANRSIELINDPSQYDYDYWGLGSNFVYSKN